MHARVDRLEQSFLKRQHIELPLRVFLSHRRDEADALHTPAPLRTGCTRPRHRRAAE
jgi:hypothetical protein